MGEMIEFEAVIHPIKVLQTLDEELGTGSAGIDPAGRGRRGPLTGPLLMFYRGFPRLRERGPCGKDRPALRALWADSRNPGHAAVAQW
jgi:hypothetical protein